MSCMSVCVSVRLCSTASYKPHDSNIFVLCVPLCRCYLRLCVFVASTTEIKLRSSIDKYIHFTCIYIILYYISAWQSCLLSHGSFNWSMCFCKTSFQLGLI